jgi:predicted flap endonuclease-1-like 5' DNA nuclease
MALDRELRLRGQVSKDDWVGQAKRIVEATAV